MMRLKVAWLAPYPAQDLEPDLRVTRRPRAYHPCSWIVNLATALVTRPDIDLHLITESTLVAEDQTITRAGITFHVVRQGLPLINRGFPSWFPLDVLSGFRLNAHRLGRVIHSIQPDIVHAHGTEAAYALAALNSGAPCLVSIQGIITEYYKTNPDFRFRIVRHWEQDQVRRAKYFTCRTDFDTGFVRRTNPAAHIFHIHEAMNPVFFRGQWELKDEPHILFVGGLQERKGIAVLIRAVGLVKKTIPAIRLAVIGGGDGEFADALHRLVAELGLADNVAFLGQKNAAEIAEWHRKTQIFVLPSDNENSPNTLAEAMVSGMPVIATKAGGIPSMVTESETGLLVPPRDPQTLAEKITRLLQAPATRQKMGERAREIGRSRHWPATVAEQTMNAYREILAQAAARNTLRP